MLVKFGINIGSRDAQQLGLDHTECTRDSVLDLPESKVAAIKKLCGEFSVMDAGKKAKVTKPEPSESELEKLTAPAPVEPFKK